MTKPGGVDWEELKTFDALVRERTVRRAADALGIHHSTVARRLERLEARLGTRLFERLPEGLSPTDAAAHLWDVTDGFSRRLLGVEGRIAGGEDAMDGRVTLTVSEAVARLCLIPRLHAFAGAHPGIEIDFLTTDTPLDIARREADIAVRMDDRPPDGLVGKRLFAYTQAVYATEAYLERLEAGEPARWIAWSRGAAFREAVSDTPWADAPISAACAEESVQRALAVEGFGLALLPCYTAGREPLLRRAMDTPPRRGRDIWVLTQPDLRHAARIRAVMAFVESALREDEAAFRDIPAVA